MIPKIWLRLFLLWIGIVAPPFAPPATSGYDYHSQPRVAYDASPESPVFGYDGAAWIDVEFLPTGGLVLPVISRFVDRFFIHPGGTDARAVVGSHALARDSESLHIGGNLRPLWFCGESRTLRGRLIT